MTFAIIAASTAFYATTLFAMDVVMHKFGAVERDRRLREIYQS